MNFIESGVEGLDEQLGGGIPLGKSIMICGGPGSGKTTFLAQFLVHGAEKTNEKGLLVLLNQSYLDLVDTCESIDIDIEKYISDNKIMIIDSSPVEKSVEDTISRPEWYIMPNTDDVEKFKAEELFAKIEYVCKEYHIKRVAIDSCTSLRLDFTHESEFRDEHLRFTNSLSMMNVTTIFSSETTLDMISVHRISEAFLCQGVIILHNILTGVDRKRYIEVLKLRGVNHKIGLKQFTIKQNGITIDAT